MDISINNTPNLSTINVQNNFGVGMLKKSLNNEEALMQLLLNAMPQAVDHLIGQNVDLTA